MTEPGAAEPEPGPSPWRLSVARFTAARHRRPFTMTFAFILPIPAVLALAFGDRTSQALTNLGAGTYSRLIGILLLVGCALILHATATRRALNECVGMVLVAMGCYLYGAGVIIGLAPLGGIVAGCGFIGIGTGFLLSMFSLTTLARLNQQGGETGETTQPVPDR